MLDHYIQKNILYRLAFEDSLSFSELKPDDLDNKLFTYHLKKVTVAGFVEKDPDGHYRLTSKGRRIGKGALTKDDRFLDRAYSVLFLVVRQAQTGDWLLFRRQTQPLRGLTGFMHAKPTPGIPLVDVARTTLQTKTGLDGTFTVTGQAYFTFKRDGQLESYTHATILVCTDATGALTPDDETGEYLWVASPDFSAAEIIPTAPAIVSLATGHVLFHEGVYTLDGSIE